MVEWHQAVHRGLPKVKVVSLGMPAKTFAN